MIVPVMAISNLVLTQQIYSEETNGAHAHNRDRVPLNLQTNNQSESDTRASWAYINMQNKNQAWSEGETKNNKQTLYMG